MEEKELVTVTEEAIEKKAIRAIRLEVVRAMLDELKKPDVPPETRRDIFNCLTKLVEMSPRKREKRKPKPKKPSFKTLVNRGQRPKPTILADTNDAKVTSFLDSLTPVPNQ